MRAIRYEATISYTDELFGTHESSRYRFFARNEEDARAIATELFLITEGVSCDMGISVSPVMATRDEERTVDNVLVSVLREMKKVVENITYPEFIDLFIKFDGKHLVLGAEPSFIISFMGFELKLYMKDHKADISRREIVYTDCDGRVYVIRNSIVYIAY